MKKWIGIATLLAVGALVFLVNFSARGKKDLSTLRINEPAPAFTLTDPEGTSHSLSDYKGKYVVMEWINHGCPYVQKHYDTGNMQRLQKEMKEKGIVWLSICSSAKGKQGFYTAAEWKNLSKEKGSVAKAVLLDPEGKVGRQYGAKTTPHMFIINPEGTLVYQGAIDDKPTAYKSDVPKAKNYVKTALVESIQGKPVTTSQTPSYGCSVKYN